MIASQPRNASFCTGIGNPISPRVAAVSELILTVSTLASAISTLCSRVQELPKTRENSLANVKAFSLVKLPPKPLHHNNIRLAYSYLQVLTEPGPRLRSV